MNEPLALMGAVLVNAQLGGGSSLTFSEAAEMCDIISNAGEDDLDSCLALLKALAAEGRRITPNEWDALRASSEEEEASEPETPPPSDPAPTPKTAAKAPPKPTGKKGSA